LIGNKNGHFFKLDENCHFGKGRVALPPCLRQDEAMGFGILPIIVERL
jgi:hypothetical protein